eukprot:TRINITY_DN441_c0_g3_i1.p1 TRINITY_DN441_c0_g3~~TRINITY_DN441_c0_g3_i1.p1  ORF type:complete len:401 (+),score=81.76 TRINITY_DN441_c0_g3_i1:75-1205(+)
MRRAVRGGLRSVMTEAKKEGILERLRNREERMRAKREKVLLNAQGDLPGFDKTLKKHGLLGMMQRIDTKTLQVNIGLLCNQSCTHCHVESSPARVLENMDERVIDRLVELLKATDTITTLDITGGAPEMNPFFRKLVTSARAAGVETIIDRCNLTVLSLDGQEDTAEFLAANKVMVIASMPCYSHDNVDAQRGDGVFDLSIDGLKKLNSVGYGKEGTGLTLNLVYNPLGPFLPPKQEVLEVAYKEKLLEVFGIHFTSLFTITNLPVKRFADDLKKEGKLAGYMSLLVSSFNPSTVASLMCRDTVSIKWDGDVHDCDFNQQLQLPLGRHAGDTSPLQRVSIWDIANFNEITGRQIGMGPHCYGCTAGSGSSCGGALE